jgi:CheY-like chemotaxis protein
LLSCTSLDSDQADYVDKFQRNCRWPVALINDFLDFGRIEAGALRVDQCPYKVRQAVYDAVHTFAETAARRSPATAGLRLLIAEDEKDDRSLLLHYLQGEPVDVQFAPNGQEAVNLVVGGAEFDLILMDLDMPVLDGYAATRQIREWQSSRGIPPTPIIALSAHAPQELVRASLEAGCNAHLDKLIERAVLIEAIYRYTVSDDVVKLVEQAGPSAGEVITPDVAELVPQYLASKWKQMEEAQGRLLVHDLEPVRRFGHNLRGTARGYGFPPLENIGRDLEVAAASQEESRIAELLECLRQFLEQESMPV